MFREKFKNPYHLMYYYRNTMKNLLKLKNDKINYLFIKSSDGLKRVGEGNPFSEINLIIDERLFAFMVSRNILLGHKDLDIIAFYAIGCKPTGTFWSDDMKLHYVFTLNPDKLINIYNVYNLPTSTDEVNKIIDGYKDSYTQVKNAINGIEDGSEHYHRFMDYLSRAKVKELCKYNKNIKLDETINRYGLGLRYGLLDSDLRSIGR